MTTYYEINIKSNDKTARVIDIIDRLTLGEPGFNTNMLLKDVEDLGYVNVRTLHGSYSISKKKPDETQFEEEEMIIADIIKSARKIQDFIWGDMNKEAGLEEYKRIFRKRLVKMEEIKTTNPHWEREMKKRLLQVAAMSVNMIYRLNQGDVTEGIHPSLPSNLNNYSEKIE